MAPMCAESSDDTSFVPRKKTIRNHVPETVCVVGFYVSGLGFSGSRVLGFGFWCSVFGFRFSGFGFRVCEKACLEVRWSHLLDERQHLQDFMDQV